MAETSKGGVRALTTVLNTLDLLRIIVDAERPIRLSEVARRTHLSRATAYQRLLTLVEAGFLELMPDQTYRLSLYPVRLAQKALAQAGIGPRSEAVMTELMQVTGETVSLSVLDAGRPCIVARVDTNMLLRAEQKVGSHISLSGSASGRVLAAFATVHDREFLGANGEELPEEHVLDATRADGYAISSGYSNSGVVGIAAPVFGPDDRCVGALSLVIPETRYQLNSALDPLKQAAARLSAFFTRGHS